MEICRLCECYIVIYVIILSFSAAHCKTFSINEALAASEKSFVTELPVKRISTSKIIDKNRNKQPLSKKLGIEIPKLKKPLIIKDIFEKRVPKNRLSISQTKLPKRPKNLLDILEERFSRNKSTPHVKFLKPPKSIIPEKADSQEKNALKTHAAYEIFIPLKHQKLTSHHRPYYLLKNQSVKREAEGRQKYGDRYTPLLKSIRLLFDDLLRPDSGESTKNTEDDKYKTLSYSTKDHDIICKCTAIPKQPKTNTQKETMVTSDTKTVEVTASPITTTTTPATTTTDYPTLSNVSNIRSDPIVPSLPPRDTSSIRGNNNGLTEGSSSTRDWSSERNFSRNNGGGEYNTEQPQNEASKTYDQENTNCDTGDSPGCLEHVRGNNGGTRILGNNSETELSEEQSKDIEIQQIFGENERKSTKTDISNKSETGRNETKGSGDIFVTDRSGGSLSTNKRHDFREPLQPISYNAYSDSGIREHLTSHKRVIDRSSTTTETNQRILTKDQEGLALTNLPGDLNQVNMSNSNNNQLVMIIDGYSVASDKNGNHKVLKNSSAVKEIHMNT